MNASTSTSLPYAAGSASLASSSRRYHPPRTNVNPYIIQVSSLSDQLVMELAPIVDGERFCWTKQMKSGILELLSRYSNELEDAPFEALMHALQERQLSINWLADQVQVIREKCGWSTILPVYQQHVQAQVQDEDDEYEVEEDLSSASVVSSQHTRSSVSSIATNTLDHLVQSTWPPNFPAFPMVIGLLWRLLEALQRRIIPFTIRRPAIDEDASFLSQRIEEQNLEASRHASDESFCQWWRDFRHSLSMDTPSLYDMLSRFAPVLAICIFILIIFSVTFIMTTLMP
ncbi:hypothetical protein M422DRAFT_29307 [Sphaerobolus stellatus SS14]|nr:hypothetical protein M422DRAFT_29307 [Sphaerobolus stellatus SS14]